MCPPLPRSWRYPRWQPGGCTALQCLAGSRQGSLHPSRVGPVCRIRLSTVVKGPRTSEGGNVPSVWGRLGEPLGGDSSWGYAGGQAGQVSSGFSFHRPDRQRVSSWHHPSEGSVDLPRGALGLGVTAGSGNGRCQAAAHCAMLGIGGSPGSSWLPNNPFTSRAGPGQMLGVCGLLP